MRYKSKSAPYLCPSSFAISMHLCIYEYNISRLWASLVAKAQNTSTCVSNQTYFAGVSTIFPFFSVRNSHIAKQNSNGMNEWVMVGSEKSVRFWRPPSTNRPQFIYSVWKIFMCFLICFMIMARLNLFIVFDAGRSVGRSDSIFFFIFYILYTLLHLLLDFIRSYLFIRLCFSRVFLFFDFL